MEKEMTNPAALAAFAKGDIENAIVASTPGGIEAQEKRGQEMLVASQDMPLELKPSKEAFEALGFTFGAGIDKVFQQATLPPGWKRQATDHSMWSEIVDDQGRKRVAVFYKAAFYDRKAHARLERRYSAGPDYSISGDVPRPVGVFDQDKMIWTAGEAPKDYTAENSDVHQALEKAAMTHLEENYPDWVNPLAYW